MWVWLKDQVSAASGAWGSGSQGDCAQMTLGTRGRWRKASCAGQYRFLCETEITSKIQKYTDVIHSARMYGYDNTY